MIIKVVVCWFTSMEIVGVVYEERNFYYDVPLGVIKKWLTRFTIIVIAKFFF